MFIMRQMTAKLAQGQVTSLGAGIAYPFRMEDVPRNMILVLAADGKYTSDTVAIQPNGSLALPLPNQYTAGKRLRCLIRSNDICKAHVVSPDHGTSDFLIKGTQGATLGAHDGYLVWTGTVTSITLSVPSTSTNSCSIDYMLYELPDITLQSAFRDGYMAFGVVVTP